MGKFYKKKILIVDDMELNRQILSLILKEEYSILEAGNGSEALEILKQDNHISLIMLDIVMPVMDGFEFLEKVKGDTTLKGIPIIFVTAEAYRENIIKGVRGGVCDVIAKPFDPYLVSSRVDHLIQLTEERGKRSSHKLNQKGTDIALIVDDIAMNRELLKISLEKDYKIMEADNGQTALEVLHSNKGNIAVVLLDIIMPIMDGVEMMSYARKAGLLEHVPVIAITAENSPVKVKRMKELGICEIIHKPFDPAVITNRINNMIELYSKV